MGYIPHKVEDFHRRSLSSKADTDGKRVELLTYINGKQFSMQGSTKGEMMLFVSRPDDTGFALEIVEQGVAPYADVMAPDDPETQLRSWQRDACRPEKVWRRGYRFDGDALNEAERIDVQIRIDGSSWLSMRAREPGLMGFVRTRNGFEIHVVGPKKAEYTGDRRGPDTETYPLYPWQIEALGLVKE